MSLTSLAWQGAFFTTSTTWKVPSLPWYPAKISEKDVWYLGPQAACAKGLLGGANGDLLLKDECHVPRLPGLLLLVPWPCGRPLLTRASAEGPQTQAGLGQSLVGSLLLSLGPGAHKVGVCPPRVSGGYEV